MRVEISGFVVLLLATLLSVQAHAQVAGGTLSGTISDPSGAVISDAQIPMRNVATGSRGTSPQTLLGSTRSPTCCPGIMISQFHHPICHSRTDRYKPPRRGSAGSEYHHAVRAS